MSWPSSLRRRPATLMPRRKPHRPPRRTPLPTSPRFRHPHPLGAPPRGDGVTSGNTRCGPAVTYLDCQGTKGSGSVRSPRGPEPGGGLYEAHLASVRGPVHRGARADRRPFVSRVGCFEVSTDDSRPAEQLHRPRDGQLQPANARGDVLGHEPRSHHHRRPWHRDARAEDLDERGGGHRRAAQRPHRPQRDGRQVRRGGHRRLHVGAAHRGHALHADRAVWRSHPSPDAAEPAGRRPPGRLARGARQPRVRQRRDVPRRVTAQERHPWSHRPRDAAQRLRPLRARPRWAGPVGTLFRRRRARRAVPGLLGAGQAGSGHPQQRVPVDQARTDHPARRRRGLGGRRVVGVGVGLRQRHPRLRPDSLVADAHADAKRGRDDSGRRGDRRLRSSPGT